MLVSTGVQMYFSDIRYISAYFLFVENNMIFIYERVSGYKNEQQILMSSIY